MTGGPAYPFSGRKDKENSVGCLSDVDWYGAHSYKAAHYYSFPGHCKYQPYNSKTRQCYNDDPGGICAHPDGRPTCTWTWRPAGELRISELNGVGRDSEAWQCEHIGPKWEQQEDSLRCFWNRRDDALASAERVKTLELAFQHKYPHDPAYAPVDCDQ